MQPSLGPFGARNISKLTKVNERAFVIIYSETILYIILC